MDNPFVSIIVPTYNSGKTLRTALESVSKQSFQEWECIVVDGASTDDTVEIIKEYCEADPRFRYISEPDHGIYDAFNKGWKLAVAPWIHYLGSDDSLTEDGMSKIVPELDKEYAVVSGDVYLERVDGSVKNMLTNGFDGCHQGMLMQRDIIEKLGGFDESYRIIADKDLVIRVEKAGYKIKNVRAFLAYFSANGTSQSITALYKIMKERYRIYKTNKVVKHPFIKSFTMFLVIHVSMIYRRIRRVFKIDGGKNK